MKKYLFALCAVPALALPALAHNFSQKGYGQLKAETQNFAHASSSKTAKINAPMPNFSAPTLDGKGLSKASFKGKMALFVLADTQCPCVQAVEERIKNLSNRYKAKGLRVVYVFSKPDERAIDVARFMQNHIIGFPAIIDKNQRLLKMLDGRCSSEVYLFDRQAVLRYHGRVDDETFNPKAARQHNLADAINAVSTGKPVTRAQAPAMGCAIPRI
ncbi:thiol-disulfide oxidoreductase ResA [Abditibacteriota bacterium]|nr:thiol-disulfide oxidoreductase ResA [Abditibacteriota bacterium]